VPSWHGTSLVSSTPALAARQRANEAVFGSWSPRAWRPSSASRPTRCARGPRRA